MPSAEAQRQRNALPAAGHAGRAQADRDLAAIMRRGPTIANNGQFGHAALGIRNVANGAIPPKALKFIKRCFRRECRKPAGMSAREYFGHLMHTNTPEIPRLPTNRADPMLNMLTEDELADRRRREESHDDDERHRRDHTADDQIMAGMEILMRIDRNRADRAGPREKRHRHREDANGNEMTGSDLGVTPVGFDEDLRLLEYPANSFPAYRLVQRLLIAKRDLLLAAELRLLDRFDLVILDDIGYIQQNREEMEVLFTFLSERYERRSMAIRVFESLSSRAMRVGFSPAAPTCSSRTRRGEPTIAAQRVW